MNYIAQKPPSKFYYSQNAIRVCLDIQRDSGNGQYDAVGCAGDIRGQRYVEEAVEPCIEMAPYSPSHARGCLNSAERF